MLYSPALSTSAFMLSALDVIFPLFVTVAASIVPLFNISPLFVTEVAFIVFSALFVNFPLITSTSFCVTFASLVTSPDISNLPSSPVISFLFVPALNVTVPEFTIPFVVTTLSALVVSFLLSFIVTLLCSTFASFVTTPSIFNSPFPLIIFSFVPS